MIDVTAIIVFHREGVLAESSLQSFDLCCRTAENHGVSIERIAVIDKGDEATNRILESHRHEFDSILRIDEGDLGSSRNAAIRVSAGKYLTFFDGDDLWGEDWIWRAHEMANQYPNAIYHPLMIYYFNSEDYKRASVTNLPPSEANSFFFFHCDSADRRFNPLVLVVDNVWTANSFALADVYHRFPYRTVDRGSGFGVEDWTWNAETLSKGVRHIPVPMTVHCVRVKQTGSLSTKNVGEKLIPAIHLFSDELGLV